MASKKRIVKYSGNEQESIEAMEMLLSLMKRGECIGGIDFGRNRYQLWDYKTSQQCRRAADIIVGIWLYSGRCSYMILKRSMLKRLN